MMPRKCNGKEEELWKNTLQKTIGVKMIIPLSVILAQAEGCTSSYSLYQSFSLV